MKKWNEPLSLALALALSASLAVPALAQEDSPFPDVPTDHWAFEAIRQAQEETIIIGMADGTFAPDDELTTAQFATIATKAFYWREMKELTDVPDGPWYARVQKMAEEAGLMEGAGVEDWDAPMTRYQMAQMLYNIAEDLELTLEDGAYAFNIGDMDQVPERYRNAVLRTYLLGLLSGMDEKGTFAGDQSLTRAQAAVIYGKLEDALTTVQGPMERVLQRKERFLANNTMAFSRFTRYPGPNGTAYVSTNFALHGGYTVLDYVDQEGNVLNIDGMLPSYFMFGSSHYFSPDRIGFSEDGSKLTFVTPIIEGKGGFGEPEEVKDWGDTLCTVDLTTGTMESMVPAERAKSWRTIVNAAGNGDSDGSLSVTLVKQSGQDQPEVQVDSLDLPFAGMKVDMSDYRVSVGSPAALIDSPAFSASRYGEAYQALKALDLPDNLGIDPDTSNTPAQREAAEAYFQVSMNGQLLLGDLSWVLSEDGEVVSLDFITDRAMWPMDGDTITVWMGLPQA